MRIGVLNWRDSEHPDRGGAELFVHEVCRRWVEWGHEVTLCSSSIRGRVSQTEINGVAIVRRGRLATGMHHVVGPRLFRTVPTDVVIESINTVPYMLPWRRRFPPFVSVVHQMAVDVWDSHLPPVPARLARRVEPHFYRPYRLSPVVAVSRSTEADLRRAGVGDVTVIPQGGIGPQAPRAKDDSPTALFVGRLTANKRPDHAIAALRTVRKQVEGARLWIIGEGPMKDELERNAGPAVEFLGRLGESELRERMARAHLLLVTSVREGWGLVVTEAAALGTPTVAYDVPGLRDSVRHGVTGMLSSVDPQALGRTAAELLIDRDRLEGMSQAARSWGAEHSWDRTARGLLGIVVLQSETRAAAAGRGG